MKSVVKLYLQHCFVFTKQSQIFRYVLRIGHKGVAFIKSYKVSSRVHGIYRRLSYHENLIPFQLLKLLTGFILVSFFFVDKEEQVNKIYHSVRLTTEEMKTILTLIVNKARPDITIPSKRSIKDQSLTRKQLLNYLTLSLMLGEPSSIRTVSRIMTDLQRYCKLTPVSENYIM